MEPPLAPGSLTAVALGAIVTELERVELEFRRLEAERVRLLGEAMELAGIESEHARPAHARLPELHAPEGSRGELAYRAIRAEIATVLHVSERTVDRQLAQAHTLTRDYPAVHAAIGAGEVSARHAAVIVDAGAVIDAGTTIDAGAGLPEGELGSDTGTDAGTDTGTDAGTDTGTDADTGCVASEAELRERRHAYTEAALVAAMDRTPAGLAVQARRLAERYAQVPLDVRHARARRHRRVWVTGRDDGMADLTAFLPATEAYAIRDRLTRMARSITDTERHDTARTKQATQRRSRDEVRADVLTDLLLGGDPDTGGRVPVMPVPEAAAALTRAPADMGAGLGQIRAVVQVITPAHVLPAGAMPPGTGTDTGTGADTDTDTDTATPEPGDDWPHMRPELPELVGYGPIDTVTVRRLAGHAPGWDLTREHPVTGAILGVDRYRPTEQMRRLLRARDQHCRFPGCRAPAHRCDIDHTLDWADGGRTETSNLAHLCRGHHTLKHHTGWQVRQENDGVLVWTAPTGRKHATYPERGRDKRDHDKRDPGSGPPGNGRPSNVRFTPAPETEPSTPSASGNGIPY